MATSHFPQSGVATFGYKLDSLWKRASCCKALVVMPRVKVGEHYFLKSNAHVANEKLYFAKGSKTVL